jgi:dienelactone hydrolase
MMTSNLSVHGCRHRRCRAGFWVSRLLCAGAVLLTACDSHPTGPTPPATPLAGFVLAGNPESSSGAIWTYAATADGTRYDLRGILLKPSGSGPFPAVIISHGAGGNANGISSGLAAEMVRWGLVCIATNYTHAGGVPIGAPGTASEPGASAANVLRARKLVDILGSLGYVDLNRLAAHGHSMGAFVTTAALGVHPDLFRAASHTAGGVRTGALFEGPAPVESQAAGIRTPYQLHHGTIDTVVALSADQRLDEILSARGAVHELIVYQGLGHPEIAQNPTMLDRVRAWYMGHGLF